MLSASVRTLADVEQRGVVADDVLDAEVALADEHVERILRQPRGTLLDEVVGQQPVRHARAERQPDFARVPATTAQWLMLRATMLQELQGVRATGYQP